MSTSPPSEATAPSDSGSGDAVDSRVATLVDSVSACTLSTAGTAPSAAHTFYTAKQLAAIAAAEREDAADAEAEAARLLQATNDFIRQRELGQEVKEDAEAVARLDPGLRERWEKQLGKPLKGVRLIADRQMTLQELADHILGTGLDVHRVAASGCVREEYLARENPRCMPRIEFASSDFVLVYASLADRERGYVGQEVRDAFARKGISAHTVRTLEAVFTAMETDEARLRSPQYVMAKKLPPMRSVPTVDTGARGRIAAVAIHFPPNASMDRLHQCLQTVMTGILNVTLKRPPADAQGNVNHVVEYYFQTEPELSSSHYCWYFRWHTVDSYVRHFDAIPDSTRQSSGTVSNDGESASPVLLG